jgi:serine/threonine protein kinase
MPADDSLQDFVKDVLAAHDGAAEQTELVTATDGGAASGSGEAGGSRIGRYRIIEPLGEGGFGMVWRAEQTEPVRREVALKIIKLGMDTKEVIARFEQERQALAVMDHPGIAKVLDAGTTPLGRPYFVMELVRGQRLTDYCDQRRLATRERLRLFIAVCHAIQHAHQKGIIHRDIKPSNILVTEADAGPQPKVIDFGIAKATTARLTDHTLHTAVGAFIGTPSYMSPEQADPGGLDLDTRTDIYSLGVLLYELLTGRTPLDFAALRGAGPEAIRRVLRERDPVKPSTRLRNLNEDEQTTVARARAAAAPRLAHQLRGDLDWIVMKAIEKDRTRRYDTAAALARDLERHLERLPVHARPPSTAYVVKRFVQRHRGAVAAAAAIFVSLVAGLAVSVAMFFREKDARARADTAAAKSAQVARFLKDMLASVGPSKAQGRDATMLREILDATAARLGTELRDQPEVEAELRAVLGNTYGDLEEFEASEKMLREALRLRRATLAPGDPQLAGAVFAHAVALDLRDDLTGARAALQEVIALRRAATVRDDAALGEALEFLAWLDYREGDLETAEKNARESLALLRAQGEAARSKLASALSTLGSTLHKVARLREAEALHREELAVRRAVHGASSLEAVTAANNLAQTLVSAGKLDEAVRLAREALALEHKLTQKPFGGCTDALHKILGTVLEYRGDFPGAVRELETALTAATAIYGANHRYTNDKRGRLIRLLVLAGQLDAADAALHEARAVGGDAADNSIEAAAARLALARGDLATAEREARADLERTRRETRVPSVETASAQQVLAAILRTAGRVSEAEPLAREAVRILRPEENAGTPLLVAAQAELAATLRATRPDDADAASLEKEVAAARARAWRE